MTVIFGENASPTDEAKAFLHANILARNLSEIKIANRANVTKVIETRMEDAELKARVDLDKMWERFQTSCFNKGWDLSKTELQTLGYEVTIA